MLAQMKSSLETVWPDGYIIFQYLATYNIERLPKKLYNLAKVGSKICQTQNKPSTIWQNVASGEISPNLVTLLWNHASDH